MFREALGGGDQACLEMHVEAEIKSLSDALGGRDRARLEMHLEAEIM